MSLYSEVSKEPFWAMGVEEALGLLESSAAGLAEAEAQKRRQLFGPNEIQDWRSLAKIKIVLNQLKSPLILILVFAGVLTFFLKEWVNTAVIFAAVLVNTFLGFFQENKAENALALLKNYIRFRSRVRRGGEEREIDAIELVPGDVIKILQGDRVPADARLFFVKDFEVDESILTGESLPVEKDLGPQAAATALADRKSMIFSGTLAVSGFAEAVVTATDNNTEFGKIAKLVEKGREATPLQRSLSRFSAKAGLFLGVLVAALFGLGVYFGYGLLEMFLIAVAVAVSAVPESLPVALTVILAVGVERLAKRKGVVRKLLAAETLGSTSLILTDKTGTLTQARMELTSVLPHGGLSQTSEGDLLREALINTDVVVENPKDSPENWRLVGRAVETALVKGAAVRGVKIFDVLRDVRILDRIPFSSEHKFSAAVFSDHRGTRLAVLGAPEIILRRTGLSREDQGELLKKIDELALAGERVLGVAFGKIDGDHLRVLHERKFKDLEFAGLLSLRDPLRSHVAESIRRIAEAGVRTVIVTGDHSGTAEAVARELGMIDGKGAILTGDDLNYLTGEELKARADQVSVYARVTPEQKFRLVKLYQEKGEVVAVTGDGINDAPALHTADIGVAIGSGTDVAKSAADMVILDDNFETIVSAIEEGRGILANIRKVLVYLLSDSLDELFLIGGSLLVGLALPLNALQILFVNFFADSFPAMALAFEKGIDGLGRRPRKLDRNLFDPAVRFLVVVIGAVTSALLFVLYFFLIKADFAPELARTFIFASFATYTLFLSFSLRSLEKSIISYNPFSNRYLNVGIAIGLGLTALVIYLPWLQKIFGTAPLPLFWLGAVIGVGVFNIGAVEFGKWIFRIKSA